MFTGIIDHIGAFKGWKGDTLFIQTPYTKVKKGESIALDGVCLTVVSGRAGLLGFDVTEETRRKTTLGAWKPGSKVNLERAMRLGDALGGHMVQGHVEGVGRLIGRTPEPAGVMYRFQGYPGLGRFLATKGSVAVDGISLTVVDPAGDDFSVAIIPHTEKATTLGVKAVGDPVNLESDIIARQVVVYLEKLVPAAGEIKLGGGNPRAEAG